MQVRSDVVSVLMKREEDKEGIKSLTGFVIAL